MAAAIKPIRGEQHYKAKLTEEDVSLIRLMIEERTELLDEARKLTNKKIAEKFGVGTECIVRIAAWQTWRHI